MTATLAFIPPARQRDKHRDNAICTAGPWGGTAVLTNASQLACTGGEIEAEVSYAPRPEYGLIHPILVPVAGGVSARGGADRLLLSTPVSFDVDGATATARCG
jgi:hypothetical protein